MKRLCNICNNNSQVNNTLTPVLTIALALFTMSSPVFCTPSPEDDTKLIEELEKRLADTAKLDDVKRLMDEYRNSRETLIKLRETQDHNGINEQSENMLRGPRQRELIAMEEKGPCATHPVVYEKVDAVEKVKTADGREDKRTITVHRYTSDGSCLFANDNLQEFSTAFERVIHSLKTPTDYPKRFDGFNYVLEFLNVDAKGVALPDQSKAIDGKNFNAYIAVASPLQAFCLGYYFTGDIKELVDHTHGQKQKEFTLTFKTPDVAIDRLHPIYYAASGAGNRSRPLPIIKRITGAWYVHWDSEKLRGTIRYYTQGDFVVPPGENSYARKVLLDTLIGAFERAHYK